MEQRRRPKFTVKRYLVAIPIPFLTRHGRKLNQRRIDRWVRLAEEELTRIFGGATAMPSPGTNIIDGRILYEEGQILVCSACANRKEFLNKRDRLAAFVERMGDELNQDSVFLLAFRSDSLLIEIEKSMTTR